MDKTLEKELGATESAVPAERVERFKRLYSQTSMFEREALYAAARYDYTGEGEILDIGTAAGGSTYCLAAGVLDSDVANKKGRVHGFDLFDGFSLRTFAGTLLEKEGLRFGSDLELFDWQIDAVSAAVVRTPANLITNPEVLKVAKKVEIAHIDAAKSLPLWMAIFDAIAPTVIPGKTIWIFQDFEVIAQPWQIYGLAELLRVGKFIGGAHYGTMFFRFDAEIPQEVVARIAADSFSLGEKIANVDTVYDLVEDAFPRLFAGSLTFGDLRNGTKAFCHNMAGDKDSARRLFSSQSEGFRAHPGMKGYLAYFA